MLAAASSAAVASSNGKALWYLTRGTGLVAMVLLSVSLALGILEANRWTSPRWPRFITAALHKNVSLLATAFIGVHVVTSIVDAFAPIRWLDVILPFASPYRPIWLGLGAVATDLLIAVTLTSLLRQRIGYRTWKAVHWAAYACWPIAVVHGLGTGSDTRHGWAQWVYATGLVLVAASVWWRLASGWTTRSLGRRLVGAAGSVLVPLGIVGFVLVGPLRPGWATRAGTPKSLLASSHPAAASAPPSSAPFTGTFRDRLSGTISEDGPTATGETTVTITGTMTGDASGVLQVSLVGLADPSGGVSMSSSSASLGTAAQPSLYRGEVSNLAGNSFDLSMHDQNGRSLRVAVRVRLEGGGSLTGTVSSLS